MLVELDDGGAFHHHEVDIQAGGGGHLVIGSQVRLRRARHLGVRVRARAHAEAAARVVRLRGVNLGVLGQLVHGGTLLVAEAVVPAAEQVDGGVEPHLRDLHHAGETLHHAVGTVWVGVGEVVQHALERRRDEQDAAARGDLVLVHRAGHGAQVLEHVLGLRARIALGCDRHTRVTRDLREGEGVGLGATCVRWSSAPASTKQSKTPASSTSMTSAMSRIPRS